MHALLNLSLALAATVGTPDEGSVLRDLEALTGEVQLRSFQALAELDEEQLESLATLAERVAIESDRYLEHRRSLLEIQQVTFLEFREQDLEGGEFKPVTTRSTGRANGLGRERSKEFVHSLTMIDELAREVLDPGQLLLVELLEPEQLVRCALGEKLRAPGDPLRRQAWGALEAVAGSKGGALSRKAAAEATKLVRVAEREELPAWDSAAELLRITAFLERAAHLSKDTSLRCRADLAAELLPDTRREHLQEDLKRIHLEEHPESSTLVRLLLTEKAASILRGGRAVKPSARRREVRELEEEVCLLRRQISLLNLLNGLHLTREQLGRLAEIGERAGRELPPGVAAAPSSFSSVGFPPHPDVSVAREAEEKQLERELDRLRADAERGRLPAAKEVRLVQALAGCASVPQRRLDPEAERALAEELLEVLTPAQEEVVLRFSACLIPPRDLRDPVRVGQAAGDENLGKELQRIRDLDEDSYRAGRAKIVERSLSWLERQDGTWPAGERGRALEELGAVFDEARGLDDVAFAVRRAELGARIELLGRKTRLLQELKPKSARELERRAVRYLFDPDLPVLARDIVARRERRGAADPVDLEKLVGAPSCEDGGCAVD